MDTPSSVTTTDLQQFVCFKLAREEYAVGINDIQEVIRVPHITRIPQVPKFALGVINLRGNIVTVFDLRVKLKLDCQEHNHNTKIIVADVDGEVFSFLADEILENITLEAHQIDNAPAVKMNIDRECVAGLGELEGRMITILNLRRVHREIKKEIQGYVVH